MSQQPNQPQALFTLADLWKLCRHSKKSIFILSFSVMMLFTLYPLTKPVYYVAEGSFQDVTENGTASSSTLQHFLGSMTTGSGEETLAVMHSSDFLNQAVDRLALQGHLASKERKGGLLHRIGSNLKLFYAQFMGHTKRHLVFPDSVEDLRLTALHYDGEFPSRLSLNFTSSNAFKVIDEHGHFLGYGALDAPFLQDKVSFTLHKMSENDLQDKQFALTLNPKKQVIDAIRNVLEITPQANTSHIFDISFIHTDRRFSAHFINEIIDLYAYLKRQERQKKVQAQINYLEKRKGELLSTYMNVKDKYQDYLQKNIHAGAFISVSDELAFVAQKHTKIRDELLQLQREIGMIEECADRPESFRRLQFPALTDKDYSKLYSLVERYSTLMQQKRVQALSWDNANPIQHRVDIIKEQIQDFTHSHQYSLNKHKELLNEEIQGLNKSIQETPTKWGLEKALELELDMGSMGVQKITEIVESTIISSNLTSDSFKVLDSAVAPTVPQQPPLITFSFLGAFIGCFIGISLTLVQALPNGIICSFENLQASGFSVLGAHPNASVRSTFMELSQDCKNDLRKASAYLHERKGVLTCVLNNCEDYTSHLAALLEVRGEKTLLIECDSDEKCGPKIGLSNYLLQSSHDIPLETQSKMISRIHFGKPTAFSEELLSSERFSQLLENYKNTFDHIVLVTQKGIHSNTGKILVQHSNLTFATVKHEPLSQVESLRCFQDKLTFFIADS